jgi:hypothetical protein
MKAVSFIFACNESLKGLRASIVDAQNIIGYKRSGNSSVQLVDLGQLCEAGLSWKTPIFHFIPGIPVWRL